MILNTPNEFVSVCIDDVTCDETIFSFRFDGDRIAPRKEVRYLVDYEFTYTSYKKYCL
jgi:hypothetical protein